MGALCIEEPHHCSEREFRLPLRIHDLQNFNSSGGSIWTFLNALCKMSTLDYVDDYTVKRLSGQQRGGKRPGARMTPKFLGPGRNSTHTRLFSSCPRE